MKTSAFITGKQIALQQDPLYQTQKDIKEVQKTHINLLCIEYKDDVF